MSAQQWPKARRRFNAKRAEHAGEFLVKSSAASALSAFNPSPRPRVRPRGSGRVRGDNLNAERAEHAGDFLVKSSAASALWALIRLRDLGCVRAGVAECAETI